MQMMQPPQSKFGIIPFYVIGAIEDTLNSESGDKHMQCVQQDKEGVLASISSFSALTFAFSLLLSLCSNYPFFLGEDIITHKDLSVVKRELK